MLAKIRFNLGLDHLMPVTEKVNFVYVFPQIHKMMNTRKKWHNSISATHRGKCSSDPQKYNSFWIASETSALVSAAEGQNTMRTRIFWF